MTHDTACPRFAEAISAIVDGESPAVDQRVVDAHVAGCPGCAEYRRSCEDVRRRLRVTEVVQRRPSPLPRAIAAASRSIDRATRWRPARVVLAVVAIEVIALSAVDLIAGRDGAGSAHDGRHLAAFTGAYGVLLLLVVARPARAHTALPVAGVVALALAVTALVDLTAGRVPLSGEALHLPEIVSVVLVWVLAAGPGSLVRRTASPGPEAGQPGLHLVEPDPR